MTITDITRHWFLPKGSICSPWRTVEKMERILIVKINRKQKCYPFLIFLEININKSSEMLALFQGEQFEIFLHRWKISIQGESLSLLFFMLTLSLPAIYWVHNFRKRGVGDGCLTKRLKGFRWWKKCPLRWVKPNVGDLFFHRGIPHKK